MPKARNMRSLDYDPLLHTLRFLIEHNRVLLKPPISGSVLDTYYLFCKEFGNNLIDNLQHFSNILLQIVELTTDGLILSKNNSQEIQFINTISLNILLNLLTGPKREMETVTDHGNQNSNNSTTNLDRLLNVINFEDDHTNVEINPLSSYLYDKLNLILYDKPSSFQLAKERVQFTTKKFEFIPICSNKLHSHLLTKLVYIVNNKIVSMQWSKLNKNEIPQDLINCILTKIHFVPNLKPQTDLNLGDCSYLDTCHKLNSCRYLHYLQYIPESLQQQVKQSTSQFNSKINLYQPFYTHSYCCSFQNKLILPPQWIRCDVRKFDFNILGKFSVVIADPAWNIHMNLPYGTCNDIELLQLPLNKLQENGLIFLWVTGRATELGKESLNNWGYDVINEISWIKTNQLGRTIVTGRTGHWLNHSKEHLLVGIKGNPKWLNKHIDIDIIVSTTRETSRKPDELYGIIERLVGAHARKLEIFGRDHNIRPGWFTIGNQLTGSCIHEMDVKLKYDNFINHRGKI